MISYSRNDSVRDNLILQLFFLGIAHSISHSIKIYHNYTFIDKDTRRNLESISERELSQVLVKYKILSLEHSSQYTQKSTLQKKDSKETMGSKRRVFGGEQMQVDEVNDVEGLSGRSTYASKESVGDELMDGC